MKKQQIKKRTKKVFKAREEILSLLVADKVKKAGEMASALLVKHLGDIRAWRLVAGVKAWGRFAERIRAIPEKHREELKSQALKVMRRELSSRDNLRAEVLAETLISLVPAGGVMAEEELPVTAEETPVAEEKPEEKAPAPKKAATAKKETAKKATVPKETETAKKPAAKKAPAKKPATPAKKSPAPKKTETAKKATARKKTK